MPVCDNCKRPFSGTQYLFSHMYAPSNTACLAYYIRNIRNGNTSTPQEAGAGARALKRRKLIQRREAAIRSGESLLNRSNEDLARSQAQQEEEDDVFEFKDDSVEPPTFPRIRLDLLSNKRGQRGVSRNNSNNNNNSRRSSSIGTQNEDLAAVNEASNTENECSNPQNEGIGTQNCDSCELVPMTTATLELLR